jgi:hypothetical protein
MNAIPFFPYGKFGVRSEQIDPDQIPFADVRSRREDGSPARRSTASGPFLLDLGMGEQRSQTGPTYDVDLNTYVSVHVSWNSTGSAENGNDMRNGNVNCIATWICNKFY